MCFQGTRIKSRPCFGNAFCSKGELVTTSAIQIITAPISFLMVVTTCILLLQILAFENMFWMRLFCSLCQKMIRSSWAVYDHISSITHAPCSHKRLKGTIYYALRRIHFYSQNGDILLPDSYCSTAAAGVTQKRFYLGGISKNTFFIFSGPLFKLALLHL